MTKAFKFILINREDGGVSIMQLVEQARSVPFLKIEKQTVVDAKGKSRKAAVQVTDYRAEKFWPDIAKEIKKAGVSCVSWKEIDEVDIPTDRTFRNAWKPCPKNKIAVDMDRARDIHMAKIRRARDKALKTLDVETLKGKDVQAEKQVLRDIPKNFDLSVAETPEELKTLWPKEL